MGVIVTEVDGRPAIRFVNYMGDREEMEAVHVVGPFDSVEARNAELQRLAGLPLGAPEYNGGVEFFPATMAEAVGERGWSLHVVDAQQVADAASIRGFFAAFHGDDEEDDDRVDVEDDIHPDQAALFGSRVSA